MDKILGIAIMAFAIAELLLFPLLLLRVRKYLDYRYLGKGTKRSVMEKGSSTLTLQNRFGKVTLTHYSSENYIEDLVDMSRRAILGLGYTEASYLETLEDIVDLSRYEAEREERELGDIEMEGSSYHTLSGTYTHALPVGTKVSYDSPESEKFKNTKE